MSKRKFERLTEGLTHLPSEAEVNAAIRAWYEVDDDPTFAFLSKAERASSTRRMRAALEAASLVRAHAK